MVSNRGLTAVIVGKLTMVANHIPDVLNRTPLQPENWGDSTETKEWAFRSRLFFLPRRGIQWRLGPDVSRSAWRDKPLEWKRRIAGPSKILFAVSPEQAFFWDAKGRARTLNFRCPVGHNNCRPWLAWFSGQPAAVH